MLWLDILIIATVILLNGFFAMTEMAMVSTRPARLKALQEAGKRGAAAACKLSADPNGFLSSVQVGITLVGVFASAYSGATIAESLGHWLNTLSGFTPHGEAWGLAIVVVTVTLLTLIFGELLPKRIAMAYADPIALAVAGPMQGFTRLVTPLVWVLKHITAGLLRLLSIDEKGSQTVSEEEVKTLIAEGTQSGVFAPEEQRMIEGVLRLPDRSVRAIMTPRPEIVWLEMDAPETEAIRIIRSATYSRYPVVRRGGGGSEEDVIGVVAAKSLLDAALRGESFSLAGRQQKPLFVLDSLPALRLLEMFRRTGEAMAVVLDEYGSVEGLVTLTDILEAIAGSLPEAAGDESSQPVMRADGSWLLDGAMPIDEAAQLLTVRGLVEAGQGYETLAGFLLLRFGHLPRPGESTLFNGWRFEIMDLDGRRIDKVLASRQEPVDPKIDGTD